MDFWLKWDRREARFEFREVPWLKGGESKRPAASFTGHLPIPT